MRIEKQAATPPSIPDGPPGHKHHEHADPLVIDCDRCTLRGVGCDDCVVSVLLGGPPTDVPFNETERHAIDVLAEAGLVPPLRMVEPLDTRDA